jgi:hypothetical protein
VREQDQEDVVEPDAGVIAGEDDIPRQPAPPLDPYTPEPVARPGERRAWRVMRLAWVPVLVGLAIVLYALLR